jgi:hypothetical protein
VSERNEKGRKKEKSALVVVVDTAKDVDVKGDTSGLRERLKDVRDHLSREVSDLLALELQVAAEVGAGRNVEDSAGEGLITETSSAIVLINVEKKRRQDEPRQEERTQSRSA